MTISETTLTKISEHVYWMSPGQPDRPSLCAVVGTERTLIIDAGASVAHIHLFLDALKTAGVPSPSLATLTHWHWDHVFGASELSIPIIAHAETALQLSILAEYAWDDTALDKRVRSGEEIVFCADNIKLELSEPRTVKIALPDIVFDGTLEIRLGEVSCHIRHVGGDHAGDSCVIYISPDKVLALGDCLYDAVYAPERHYTPEKIFPLLETILSFEADQFIDGHSADIQSRNDIESLQGKLREAHALATHFGADETAALAQIIPPDEDTEYFVGAFIAGIRLKSASQD